MKLWRLVTLCALLCIPGTLAYGQAVQTSAADSPITSTSESDACQKEKVAAAARGHSDVGSIINDPSDLNFEDYCVAALLNPGTGVNPANPANYHCVGKSATVTESALSDVVDTAYPDPSMPAGKCRVTACSIPSIEAGACIAATNPVSIPQNPVGELPPSGDSLLSPDTETNLPSLSQPAPVSENTFPSSIPEPASTPEPLSETQPETQIVQPENPTPAPTEPVSETPSAPAPQEPTPLPDSASAETPAPPQQNLQLPNNIQQPSTFEKVADSLNQDLTTAIDDVRGWFGLGPINAPEPSSVPYNIGIRG